MPEPDATAAATGPAVLDAWTAYLQEGWLQEGHLRTVGNDRRQLTELVYGAFCTAWVAGQAEARVGRDRILQAFALATVDPEVSAEAGDRIRRAFGRALAGLLGDTDD